MYRKTPPSIGYNLHMMNENGSSTLHKIMAGIFGLIFAASLIFMGYRVYTKPAYEAHEKEQARILAVSAVTLLAERTAMEPSIWENFSDIDTELMIDHMKIRGNWAVKVFIVKKDGYVEVTSSVTSGWNSRSPQSAEYRAQIYRDGRTVFVGEGSAGTPEGKTEPLGKIHTFRFPDEMKKVPVQITAEEYLLTDAEGREFLILK